MTRDEKYDALKILTAQKFGRWAESFGVVCPCCGELLRFGDSAKVKPSLFYALPVKRCFALKCWSCGFNITFDTHFSSPSNEEMDDLLSRLERAS